jgi:hypothetical protein
MESNLQSNVSDTFRQKFFFALRLSIFFLISGYMLFHKSSFLMMKVWWILGASISFLTILFPAFAANLKKILHPVKIKIEKGLTFMLLLLMYYGVVTPLAWLGRRVGKIFLELKQDKMADSYWIKREASPHPTTYEKPY